MNESVRFPNEEEPGCWERLARLLWLLYTWRAVQVIDRGVDLVGAYLHYPALLQHLGLGA